MLPLKKIIGEIFSIFINGKIRKTQEPEKLRKIFDLVTLYPELLKSVDKDVIVTTQFGFNLICNRSDYIGKKIIGEGIWEPLISRTLAACLDEGDAAIDIGANIGYDTILMSKLVGHTGRVIAFEPDWTNLCWLIRNLQMNVTKNVQIVSVGLGDFSTDSGQLSIDGERGHSNLRSVNQEKEFQAIMIKPLKSILDISQSERIRLVKIDIEGYEYNALVGFGEILSQVDYVLCEIDPDFLRQCGTSPYDLFKLMEKFGFTSYASDPESDGLWQKCSYNYEPSRVFKSGRKPFDALFCRQLDETVLPLVRN